MRRLLGRNLCESLVPSERSLGRSRPPRDVLRVGVVADLGYHPVRVDDGVEAIRIIES